METVLILTRHGETEENLRGIMQGHLPGHLSALGRRQAEELADRMADQQLDAVICSDLARSRDTARAVAQRYGLPLTETELLRERDWGIMTGRKLECREGFPEDDSMEDCAAMYLRAENFLDFVRESFPGKRVLAVGHGLFNQAVVAAAEGRGAGSVSSVPMMKNVDSIIKKI